jgi:hypothetical protein
VPLPQRARIVITTFFLALPALAAKRFWFGLGFWSRSFGHVENSPMLTAAPDLGLTDAVINRDVASTGSVVPEKTHPRIVDV